MRPQIQKIWSIVFQNGKESNLPWETFVFPKRFICFLPDGKNWIKLKSKYQQLHSLVKLKAQLQLTVVHMLLFDTAELGTCLNLNFLNQQMHTQAHDQTLPKETFKKCIVSKPLK